MITIKKVQTKKEYEICLMIRKAVFIEEQHVPKDQEIDSFENSSIHFLAYYNKTPVGTGRFRIKEHCIKFERIATLKAFRGKGVGKKLLKTLQDIATKEHPMSQILANVQVQAIPFYQKQGWKMIGKTFFDAGIKHQTMEYQSKK